MKKFFYIFSGFLCALFLLISCEEEGYSLDDFGISMATVENPNDEPYFYLHLDNGDVLWTTATNLYNYRPKTGQRIIADYTILDDEPNYNYDHNIKLNDAYNILTKDIFNIDATTQDSIGNDAVGIKEMWIGGDFLNVRFSYQGGDKTHNISLVRDASKEYDDKKIHLEFRHNTNQDASSQTITGIVSFNLSILRLETAYQAIDIVVHVNTYTNPNSTYPLTYNFKNSNGVNRELTTDIFDESKDMAYIE